MNKKNVITQNYLERIPVREESIVWKADSDGIVTLETENKGWANRLAQLLFKRPETSFIHLDEHGSFIWQQIDGKRDILAIGVLVEDHFGEASHPLYERLARYFQTLDSYHFIRWIK